MNLIDKLDEAEKEATPGPWQEDLGNWDIERISPREAIAQFSFEHRGAFDEGEYANKNKVHPYADMWFICKLRNAWPILREIVIAADRVDEIASPASYIELNEALKKARKLS